MKGFMIWLYFGLISGAIFCLTIIYIPFFLIQLWIYRRVKDLKETYEFDKMGQQEQFRV